jgi:hypothetical protein
MYIKIDEFGNKIFPYFSDNIYEDNPDVSFPELTDDFLGSMNIYPVVENKPDFNSMTEKLVAGEPFFNNHWIVDYSAEPLSEEEINQNISLQNSNIEQERIRLYQQISDPLFFKWQAGTSTKEEWEAARKMIKDSLPYRVQ